MESASLIAAIVLFLAAVGAFAVTRRINRFLIVVLAASSALFCVSCAALVFDSYASGVAPWRMGRSYIDVSRATDPIAFWASNLAVGAWSIFCGFMGVYLLRIAFMRRRHGP
jgi:hypothetical protein